MAFLRDDLFTARAILRLTDDEDAYREDMMRSHRLLEPEIYPATLAFRFHPGKLLVDVLKKESGDRLGGFSLHDFDPSARSCEMGYWVVPEFRGLGFIEEAALVLIEHLFREGAFARVTLICDKRNLRSIRLAEKLGFTREAYLSGVDPLSGESVIKYIYARYTA